MQHVIIGAGPAGVIAAETVRKLDPAAEDKREIYLNHNRQGDLAELWEGTGLEKVEETTIELQMDFTSFDDYWLPFLQGVGPLGAYVKDLSPESRDTLREALRNRLLGGKDDGPFTLGARAWAVRGIVPK